MTDIEKKSLSATLPIPALKGELVVVPPSPTLEERAVKIRQAHVDVAAAILTAVERALHAGLELKAAKDEVKHGRFEHYVARCGLSMKAAQNYMRLTRHEPAVRQLLAEKAQGNAYLTMAEALKFVAGLEAKKKPKRRVIKHTGLRRLFGG
jgi:hypothetical protein